MVMYQQNNLEKLHERDFNLWTEQMMIAVKNQDLNAIDWKNLMDEIEDMGKSEKRSLESYLERLVEHILKLQYWEQERERNYKHWQVEVVNFRNRIFRLLDRSPSLKKYMQDIYLRVYQDAVSAQQIEFEIPNNSFISLEKILQKDFFG
jgi:2-polyprenyl-6-methoxyphenol hydroxylase-like FAD-dependent oxidoreductase